MKKFACLQIELGFRQTFAGAEKETIYFDTNSRPLVLSRI